MKYVYELHRSGIPVYVGESKNPKSRYRTHIYHKPRPGIGMFYGQTDLELVIVAGPMTIREARDLEYKLKEEYGMIVGEKIGRHRKPKPPKVYKRRKLVSEEDMIEIKNKYEYRDYPLVKLGKEYNVSAKTIHRIIKNEY
jgi:predicted GIY-YIG superfamily endonuclease